MPPTPTIPSSPSSSPASSSPPPQSPPTPPLLTLIPPAWQPFFTPSLLHTVDTFLHQEHTTYGDTLSIFPPRERIFHALHAVGSPEDVRVVILGQDPYIRPGQATGLAFGVPKGTRPLPPSLRNMMKRLSVTDMDPDTTPFDVSLDTWAERGVLLLNTALTVREGASNSHARVWKPVTDDFLHRFAQYRHETIGPDRPGLVFLLWGSHAIRKGVDIGLEGMGHKRVCCSHPSPLSCWKGVGGYGAFMEGGWEGYLGGG